MPQPLHHNHHLRLVLQFLLVVILARLAYNYRRQDTPSTPPNTPHSYPLRNPQRVMDQEKEVNKWIAMQRRKEIALSKRSPYPRPKGETHLEELVGLMEKIYTTLADMTYIPHSAIKKGPHVIDRKVVEKYGLDPMVVRLMEMLPYVDKDELGEDSKGVSGGAFADFRKAADVEESREMWVANWVYDEETLLWRNEETGTRRHMLPWITPLTLSWQGKAGDEGGYSDKARYVLLYNARYHRLYMPDMKNWGVMPVTHDSVAMWWDEEEEMRQLRLEDEKTGGEPVWNTVWVLKLMLESLTNLSELPLAEGYDHVDEEKWEELVWLYRDNGWPDKFDPDAFRAAFVGWGVKLEGKGDPKVLYEEIKRIEGEDRILAQIGGEWGEPLPQFRRGALEEQKLPFPRWSTIGRLQAAIGEAKERLSEATDVDETWSLKWSIHQKERQLREAEGQLDALHDEYERICSERRRRHGDCSEGSERILREFQAVARDLEGIERSTREERERFAVEDIPAESLALRTNLLTWKEQELKWHLMGYEKSKAAMLEYCARTGLTPLPSISERSRAMESHREMRQKIDERKEYLLEMREWLSGVPREAKAASEQVAAEMAKAEEEIKDMEERIRGES
ncbi:hypothetical protein BCR34DRAFT_552776 [Clohesyomyces aquaticus]|uniref:Uncharacterized protein n=1 Tax=Clohesyomyces aquaticus TaxID=1231657 RepID=A0A1Y2A9Q9_9PLEO|nr:hypothetical protein BCR34DRAFT_552776 [Clohesyomyces aquaticus]